MPKNEILIQPRPLFFGMFPLFPEVKPGHQPLVVKVDWSKNAGFWNRVVVKSLTLPDGTVCDAFPGEISVLLGDGADRTVLFNFHVNARVDCKFVVELHRVSPAEVFVIDPGIILNPGP